MQRRTFNAEFRRLSCAGGTNSARLVGLGLRLPIAFVDAAEDLFVGVGAVFENIEGNGEGGHVAVGALEPQIIPVAGDELFGVEGLADDHVRRFGDVRDFLEGPLLRERVEAAHIAVGADDEPDGDVRSVLRDDEGPFEVAAFRGNKEADGLIDFAVDDDRVIGKSEASVGNRAGRRVRVHLGKAIGELADHASAVGCEVFGLSGGTPNGDGNGGGLDFIVTVPARKKFKAAFGGGAAVLPPRGGFACVDGRALPNACVVVEELLCLARGVDEVKAGVLEGVDTVVAEIGEFTFDEDIEVGGGFDDRRGRDSKGPVRGGTLSLGGQCGSELGGGLLREQ